MKTQSWLRTKLSQASTKRSGCLLLSKQTKHKQKQKHKVSTPKVPSQRRSTHLEPNFHTICFIFTDPVLGTIEGVTVLRNSDLKQDARSCVRSMKNSKLYQSCIVSQWNRQGRYHLSLRRLGLVAVGLFWVNCKCCGCTFFF